MSGANENFPCLVKKLVRKCLKWGAHMRATVHIGVYVTPAPQQDYIERVLALA
jgi:hypothetical protein